MFMYQIKSQVFSTENNDDTLRLGSIFFLDLPFRIATGKTTKFLDKFEHHESEIFVFNKIPNYKVGVPIKNAKKREETYKYRCSRIVVLLEDRRVDKENLTSLKQQVLQGETPDIPHEKNKSKHTNIAINVIERLLISLYSLFPTAISGPTGNFSPMTNSSFHECLTIHMRFFAIGSEAISTKSLWDLSFEHSSFSSFSKWSSIGYEKNLTLAQKNKIQKFLNEKLNNHFYYEIKYRARAFAHYEDSRSALLWEIIALECVTNDIYHQWFDGRTKQGEIKPKKASELRERVSHSLQLYDMVQLLCFALLPPRLRPKVEQVDQALKAITIRNKITHSLRTKDGNFHSRKLSTKDLSEARKSIIELTNYLGRIAEKST